jgi:two-component system alkaline phosphatase synthesis response regulator PhoP
LPRHLVDKLLALHDLFLVGTKLVVANDYRQYSKILTQGTRVDNGINQTELLTEGAPDQVNISLADRVAESLKLSRFFLRLFGEVTQLSADTIAFSVEHESLNGSIISKGTEIKAISIKASWFEPALKWLADRALPTLEYITDRAPTQEQMSFEFAAGCRIGDNFVAFRVKRGIGRAGRHSFKLSEIKRIPLASALAGLAVSDIAHTSFDALTSVNDGLVLVVAPDEDNIRKSLAAFLAITSGHFAGQLNDAASLLEASRLAKTDLVVMAVRAADSVDALLRLREFGANFQDVPIRGVFCCGFVKAVCPSCSRQATPDRQAIRELPEGLRPNETPSYFVGRGCSSCGLTGYYGFIGVESLVWVDEQVRLALMSNQDHVKLVELLYSKGTRPLLEDGVDKALLGQITFEALYKLVRTAPNVYLKHFKLRHHQKQSAGLDVSDDFFSGSKETVNQPLRGRSAFSGGFDLGDEDAPLFGSKPERKLRNIPLLAVVEDDPDQQSILEMVLKSSGYEVCVASDGQQGLDLIRSKMPDLVISDLMMPNMDGSQMLKQLKANPALCNIPVLILTVVSDSEKEYALLDLGADDYCEKTIQRKLLLKRIEKLLKRNKN